MGMDEDQGKCFETYGPPEFMVAVNTVLNELKTKKFPRYIEALTELPCAVYNPKLNFSTPRRRHWRALSNGHFGYDGTNATYKSFRFIFLHEVGHCVNKKQKKPNTEENANAYARMVLREIGVK